MNLHFSASLAGFIFSLGLLVSGMANPEKVLGFLDITGNWDPSLALVMVGAIAVGFVAFSKAKHMSKSMGGAPMQLPSASKIDTKLVVGSVIFGIGWGLAGFCPGPALVVASMGVLKAVIFFAAMIVGMYIYEWFNKVKT